MPGTRVVISIKRRTALQPGRGEGKSDNHGPPVPEGVDGGMLRGRLHLEIRRCQSQEED